MDMADQNLFGLGPAYFYIPHPLFQQLYELLSAPQTLFHFSVFGYAGSTRGSLPPFASSPTELVYHILVFNFRVV